MIVINVSSVPPKLRGFLTKYLWEIDAGVYVGNVNARIREALWKRITDNSDTGRATMVFPANNEQGFDFYTMGHAWLPTDYEGLKLIIRPEEDHGSLPDRTISQIPDRYIVLEIETTGVDVENDRILEIGAIRVVNGVETGRFSKLIKTEVPDDITILTGITQEMANEGVDINTALKELGVFISNDVTVGFNIRKFDMKILKRECVRNHAEMPVRQIIDLLEIVRRSVVGLKSFKLKEVAAFLGISIDDEIHSVINDCILCNRVYQLCLEK